MINNAGNDVVYENERNFIKRSFLSLNVLSQRWNWKFEDK